MHWYTMRNELVECCFMSTETVGLLGTEAQDIHLDFHTVLEPVGMSMCICYKYTGRYSPQKERCQWIKALCHMGRSLVITIFSLRNNWYKSFVQSNLVAQFAC